MSGKLDSMRFELQNYPVRTIVVKIGSQSFTEDQPDTLHGKKSLTFSKKRLFEMAQGCAFLVQKGYRVVLVSSGAILAGRSLFGQKGGDESFALSQEMAHKQAKSALGQPILMGYYVEAFAEHGLMGAQVLLTHDDLKDHKRSLNLKNMLHVLLDKKTIPVINENDSVSFEEITVGDNDQLAAMVALLIGADLLLMLTTPDGLYNQNPELYPSSQLTYVEYNDPLTKVTVKGRSDSGRGGMSTKLEAVRKVTPFGIPVILATSRQEHPIQRALYSQCGTFFSPKRDGQATARRKKMTSLAKTEAEVVVDEGARDALRKQKSLLPSGIRGVIGRFRRGDSVKIVCGGETLAIGLTEYSADELRQIRGKKSAEIAGLLGSCPSKVAFHKDNLFLIDG